MLGPGVDGHMRFGDDDDATDAMRAEAVKDIGHDGSARLEDGVHDQRSQRVCRGEHFSIAAVEVDQGMLGKCVHFK